MDDKLPHVETDLSEHVSAAPEHAKAAKPHVAQTYWYYASLTHTHAVPPPNEVFVKAATLHDAQIAAADREGGRPQDRVRRGTPVLAAEDDGYTNHIHADDLARACIAALWRGRPQRVVQVCDDTDMKTGDYYDLVADLGGLPRPARVTRAQAAEHFTPAQWSFLNESRRLSNARMKRELRLALRWPTIREGINEPGGCATAASCA